MYIRIWKDRPLSNKNLNTIYQEKLRRIFINSQSLVMDTFYSPKYQTNFALINNIVESTRRKKKKDVGKYKL